MSPHDSAGRRIRALLRLSAALPLYGLGLAVMVPALVYRGLFVVASLLAAGFTVLMFGYLVLKALVPSLTVGDALFFGVMGTLALVGVVTWANTLRHTFGRGLRVEPAAMIARARPPGDRRVERRASETLARLCRQVGLPAPALRIRDQDDPLCYSVRYPVETPPTAVVESHEHVFFRYDDLTPHPSAQDPVPADHVLVVSTGLLDTLSSRELEAVLAHEVAHLRNGDLRLLNVLLLPTFWAEGLREDARSVDEEVFGGVGPYLGLVTRFVSGLGVAVFTRGREFAADAGAATITGDPATLASALERLDDDHGGRPETDLRAVGVANVLPATTQGRIELLSTHPPTEARVERLRHMVVDLET